jgi:hypothetical protein
MANVLDTVLLVALPASGKSEVRRYLAEVGAQIRRGDFHLGDNLDLDDFPYVHWMRRTDDELAALGRARVFFRSSEEPFANAYDWGTLVHLLNEDYARLGSTAPRDESAGALFDRVDAAGAEVGIARRMEALDGGVRRDLEARLADEARALYMQIGGPERPAGATVVIELARGGPAGASLPLEEPLGYAYSLRELSPEILERASILYVWVTPEESRRRNRARANPDDPGSILHHGVPEQVMLHDYGCDDMSWLEQQSDRPGTVRIVKGSRTWHVPIARFDNRADKTSFLRDPPESWGAEPLRRVHDGLKQAFDALVTTAR